MLERRDTEGGSILSRGKIINIASLRSFQGGLMSPAYAAAKHGVLGMVSNRMNLRVQWVFNIIIDKRAVD